MLFSPNSYKAAWNMNISNWNIIINITLKTIKNMCIPLWHLISGDDSRTLFIKWIPSQEDRHNQAVQDKSEGSQYIKFLHQIGKWKFWEKS